MGINLNSPIVQEMLKNTPPGVGNWLISDGYYGKPPTVETVIKPFPQSAKNEGENKMNIVPQQNPTPYQMINGAGMQSYQLPSYQFSGALSGVRPTVPSYFDVNQPIQQPYPQQQMIRPNLGNPYPGYGYGYQSGPVVPYMGTQYYAPVPQGMNMAPPGTLYSNVEAYMYPGVQENHYDSTPSNEVLQRVRQGGYVQQLPMQGYQNPYMGIGVGVVDPQQQINQLYMMAQHNYAMEFGFSSVQEMQENDLAVLKTVSAIANRACGRSDEEIKEIIHRVYEPQQMVQQPQNRMDRFGPGYTVAPMHVTVMEGDEVIFDSKPEQQRPNMAYLNRQLNQDFEGGIQRSQVYRMNRDAFNQQMHASALERQFDHIGMMEFFNNGAFYDLHARDLELLQKKQKNERKGKLYDRDKFRREIMSHSGRPVIKNKLQEEDLRFRKDEGERPEIIQGGYGYMPGGLPLNEQSDPRTGYCFGFNLETGQMEMKPPRTDNELAQMKNKFLASIGVKVPLYSSQQDAYGRVIS